MITFTTGVAASNNPNQLIGFTNTQIPSQIYSNIYHQFGSNSIVSGQTTPFILGSSSVFTTATTSFHPQLSISSSPSSSNILVGSPIQPYQHHHQQQQQTIGTVNPLTAYTPTY
ncbi:unnamed protein product, partial [Trichobilharzia regenti]